jgi:arylsulfatase
VPCVFWAPGKIPGGKTSDEIMATIDILPTFAALAGASLPESLDLDGIDQSALITGKTKKGGREIFYYHVQSELQAMRRGDWKLMLPDGKKRCTYVDDPPRKDPELYNLRKDISETNNLAKEYPEVLRELLDLALKGPTDTTYTGW